MVNPGYPSLCNEALKQKIILLLSLLCIDVFLYLLFYHDFDPRYDPKHRPGTDSSETIQEGDLIITWDDRGVQHFVTVTPGGGDE